MKRKKWRFKAPLFLKIFFMRIDLKGKFNLNMEPFVRAGLEAKSAFKRLCDDVVNNVKSKACASLRALRCEKGIKNLQQMFFCDALAVIRINEHAPILLNRNSNENFSVIGIFKTMNKGVHHKIG